jgi:hypothetical protein
MMQGQNQAGFPQTMGQGYPLMNASGNMQGQYRNIPPQYSNLPPEQLMNLQNQMPPSYVNNQTQFMNPQMSSQFARPSGPGPNFMPPYNPGNQGYK